MTFCNKKAGACLVALGVILESHLGFAFGGQVEDDPDCGATCCYAISDKVLSGDEWYGPGHWDWCRPDWVTSWVQNYGTTHDDWPGDSWGWTDACNTDKPLARFFTALVALNSSAATPITDGNIDWNSSLDWGRHFAPDNIDELRASCPKVAGAAPISSLCINCTGSFFGLRGDRSVEVYTPYFYSDVVPIRAAALVHESWHWAFERPHVAGGAKDQRFSRTSDAGAYSATVWWLSRYAREALHAPPKMRCEAAEAAIFFIDYSFVEHPAITIDLKKDSGIDCSKQ